MDETIFIELLQYVIETDPRAQTFTIDDILECDMNNFVQQLRDPMNISIKLKAKSGDDMDQDAEQIETFALSSCSTVFLQDNNVNNLEKIELDLIIEQSFAMDFFSFAAHVKPENIRTKQYTDRPATHIQAIQNDFLEKFITQLRLHFKLPTAIITQSLYLYNYLEPRLFQTISSAEIIKIYLQVIDSDESLFNKYKFTKLAFVCVRDYLLRIELSEDIRQQYSQLYQIMNVTCELADILSNEECQQAIKDILTGTKEKMMSLINFTNQVNLQHLVTNKKNKASQYLAAQLQSRVTFNLLRATIYDNSQQKMVMSTSSSSQFVKVSNILSQINYNALDVQYVQKEFMIAWVSEYHCISQLKDPEVLLALLKQLSWSQTERIIFQEKVKSIKKNYLECYAYNPDNFKYGVQFIQLLHPEEEVLDKLIISTLMSQFNQFKEQFQMTSDKQVGENLKQFTNFLIEFNKEVDCQIQLFIPTLCQLQTTVRYINEDVSCVFNQKMSIAEFQIPGGSNQKYSHTTQSSNTQWLMATPLTAYISVCVKILRDMSSQFQTNWSIEKGLLSRVCMPQIKEIFQYYYVIMEKLYQQLQKQQPNAVLSKFFPLDIALTLSTPLTGMNLTAEFDFLESIIQKALQHEQLSTYDPFAYSSQKGYYKFACTSLTEDLLAFLNTIFSELVYQLNLSQQSLNAFMSGLQKLITSMCSQLKFKHITNSIPKLHSVFQGESTQKRFLKSDAFKMEFDDGFSSPNLTYALQNSNNKIAIAKQFEAYLKLDMKQVKIEITPIQPYQEPKQILDVYRVLMKIKLRLNTLDRIYQALEQLYEQSQNQSFCQSQPNKLIPTLREQSKNMPSQSELETVQSYFGSIFDELRSTIDNLLTFQANYAIFYGLRLQFQQLYCPTPSQAPIDDLYIQLKQIIRFSSSELAPRLRKQVLQQYGQSIALAMRFILLDSGKRARTISQRDHVQLQNDLVRLTELVSGCEFVADHIFELWVNRNEHSGLTFEVLLSETELQDIFRRADRAVSLHSESSEYLIKLIEQLSSDDLKKFDVLKEINETAGTEEFVRVLNFRRYDEENTRKFMQALKKKL
ncbi:Conserved_hypothetical protein [Hexamita inflata]|uniref:Uncharacterized protein n=1 Tax=Hexamita inflata TaxID=28002 RepID=A0AA86R315_9EUKA|nr:Conserved hypothetical protein [Hexamita inflata]